MKAGTSDIELAFAFLNTIRGRHEVGIREWLWVGPNWNQHTCASDGIGVSVATAPSGAYYGIGRLICKPDTITAAFRTPRGIIYRKSEYHCHHFSLADPQLTGNLKSFLVRATHNALRVYKLANERDWRSFHIRQRERSESKWTDDG